jgi:hypothetical protein
MDLRKLRSFVADLGTETRFGAQWIVSHSRFDVMSGEVLAACDDGRPIRRDSNWPRRKRPHAQGIVAITVVILRITWQSWETVRGHHRY